MEKERERSCPESRQLGPLRHVQQTHRTGKIFPYPYYAECILTYTNHAWYGYTKHRTITKFITITSQSLSFTIRCFIQNIKIWLFLQKVIH